MKNFSRTLLPCALLTTAPAAPEITLSADGVQVPIKNGITRVLPSSPNELVFQVSGSPLPRMRYMLEGIDGGWQEQAGDVSVRAVFYDKEGNQIGQKTFANYGVSSDWDPSPGDSSFINRRETVTAPEKADRLGLVISSAGAPTSVGIFIIDSVRFTWISPDSKPSDRQVVLFGTGAGENPVSNWTRSGLRPDMAKLDTIDREGVVSEVLALLDDNPEAHGDWLLNVDASPLVRPGERIAIEWNEIFNVGEGIHLTLTYSDLSPGKYVLRVNPLDVYGNPSEIEKTVNFSIPPPFWKRPWFLSLATFGVIVIALLVTRTILRWKLRSQLQRAALTQEVADERLRIARDLHDDLGARITQLSLMCGMAERKAETNTDRETFGEISAMTRDLVSALCEAVWTVNPRNDTLESLESFLYQLTENLCKPADIRYRLKADHLPGDHVLSSEIRHHAVLAIKEALHNSIKHSGASEVELTIRYDDPLLKVTVADNGHGFDADDSQTGNGLRNMHRRMKNIGGTVSFPNNQAGTRVSFEFPVADHVRMSLITFR